jgi:hypothetical protein
VKKLVFTMMAAAFGSQELGAPCARTLGVIPNTLELIITDAYVGVCCTSMKKACESVKSRILRPKDATTPPSRDTTYDGIVQPRYGQYPYNATGCYRITDPACNPPADLVRRWVNICGSSTWERMGSKVISLLPLNFDKPGQPMSHLEEYLSTVRTQLEQMMAAATWTMRSEVTMIVIPVRISGNWCLYQIMRGSHTQVVLRLTEVPLMIENQGGMAALGEVDQIVHALARGAMRIWARLLLRDIPN